MNSRDVDDIISSARAEWNAGNFTKAQLLFREALDINPNNAQAILGRTLTFHRVFTFRELLEDKPYFMKTKEYQELIQHDSLRPSLEFAVDMRLEKLYRDAVQRARWPDSFKKEYLDEDGNFDEDWYMDRVHQKFVSLGDYKDSAQKAEDFKELHQARTQYHYLNYCQKHFLEQKKEKCFSKKKISDWCVKYNAIWLTFIAIIAALGILGSVASDSLYDVLQIDNLLSVTLGIGSVLMTFLSAITWTKLDERNRFSEGFVLAILFSVIIWIYTWIKGLPFVFSKRKNTAEFETVSEELERCQKEISEFSAKVELYEAKFDLQ